MKDFRQNGGQGGGRNEGRGGGNYNRYQGERDSAPRLHQAVCSECNNTCEVPFRPNGSKPVYCKDCFGKKKNAFPGDRGNEKRDFAPRMESQREERPQHSAHAQQQPRDHRIDELKSQMDSMQSKLDRMMRLIEGTVAAPKQAEKPAFVEAKKQMPQPTAKMVQKEELKKAEKKDEKKEAKKPAKAAAPAKSAPAAKKPAAKAAPKAKPAAKKKK